MGIHRSSNVGSLAVPTADIVGGNGSALFGVTVGDGLTFDSGTKTLSTGGAGLLLPTFVNSSLGTNDGSTIFASAANYAAAASKRWRIKAMISGWNSTNRAAGVYVMNGNVLATATGFGFFVAHDGNILMQRIAAGGTGTDIRASGTGQIAGNAKSIYLEGDVTFGSNGQELFMGQTGLAAKEDDTVTYAGSNLYIWALASTFADIQKVTVEIF